MKKAMYRIRNIVVIVVAMIIVVAILGAAGWYETHYTLTGTVVDVNTTREIVTVEDENGNLWDFYGTGFSVNDNVKMCMDTNCTANIYDDEIEKIF